MIRTTIKGTIQLDFSDESEEASDDDSVVESEISNESRMSRVESSNESREARVQTMNQYESKARVVYEDDNLGQDNFEKRSGEITQNRKSEFQSPIFSPLNVNMYEEGKENMQISNDFNVNTHASNVSLIGNSIEKTNKSIENTSNKSIEKTSNKQGHPNKRRIVLGQVDKSKIGNPGRKHLGSRPRSLKSIQK